MPRPRVPRLTEADRLAARKLADRYVNRKGGAPSVMTAARDARRQNLNDDDRRHLKFCLKTLRLAVAHQGEAELCLDFVEVLLDRDYRLYASDYRRQDESMKEQQ